MLGLSEGHRLQKGALSISTEAASQAWGLVIAAIHLVFVSLLRSRRQSTGHRSCGGPAIMIMHLVNGTMGVPVIWGICGALGITAIEDEAAIDSIVRVSFQNRPRSPYRSDRSPRWMKVKNPKAPAVRREAEGIGGADQKEAPLPGLKKDHSTSRKFLGADAAGAGIVVRHIARLFVHFFLLLAGLTGFLFRLLLLLLPRLLPTAALLFAALAALLILLFALIGHIELPGLNKDNGSLG